MIFKLCFAKDTTRPTVKFFFNDRMVQYNYLLANYPYNPQTGPLAKRTVHYEFFASDPDHPDVKVSCKEVGPL